MAEYAKSKGLQVVKSYMDERQLVDDFRRTPESYKGYNILLVYGHCIFDFLMHTGILEINWDPPILYFRHCDVTVEYLDNV